MKYISNVYYSHTLLKMKCSIQIEQNSYIEIKINKTKYNN